MLPEKFLGDLGCIHDPGVHYISLSGAVYLDMGAARSMCRARDPGPSFFEYRRMIESKSQEFAVMGRRPMFGFDV